MSQALQEYVLSENRKRLVALLRSKGIQDEAVLSAIATVPRHLFIDSALWHLAYQNRVLPIGSNQTISHPYTVAFQTQCLAPLPNEKILEIGLGSGYQAAVLAEMGVNVYSIERNEGLWKKAHSVLPQVTKNVPITKCDDGYLGWKEHAPFDGILVTAGASTLPQLLLEQLKIGGRMLIPIADAGHSENANAQKSISQKKHYRMYRIVRVSDIAFEQTDLGEFAFVPFLKGIKGK